MDADQTTITPKPGSLFHAETHTDGHDAVLDRGGRIVPGEHRLRAFAVQAARAVMDCDAGLDWSAWIVDVHDARGRRCLTVSFAEVGPQRAA